MVFYRWLDRWEITRAQDGVDTKQKLPFEIGMELAYPEIGGAESLDRMAELGASAAVDRDFFGPTKLDTSDVSLDGEWLTFISDIETNSVPNNKVIAKITKVKDSTQAIVVFHHWGASKRSESMAKLLVRRGLTVVEMALPYHLERGIPGGADSDHFISANLGKTTQALQQAVGDGRKIIQWLMKQGYDNNSVLGTSLGSWVATLVAAHERAVGRAVLLMTAGNAAEVVWSANTTSHIQKELEAHVDLETLKRIWAPFNLETYAPLLARPGLNMHLILAKRDKAILPQISRKYLKVLEESGVDTSVFELNCGHYTLGFLPYALRVAVRLTKIFR